MILTSAPLLTDLLCGLKSITPSKLGNFTNVNSVPGWVNSLPNPWFFNRHFRYDSDLEYLYYKLGIQFLSDHIFNSTPSSQDICDFIRNWTQMNIGEPTWIVNEYHNPEVDDFSSALIRKAGFEISTDAPDPQGIFTEMTFEGQTAVMFLHIDISQIG